VCVWSDNTITLFKCRGTKENNLGSGVIRREHSRYINGLSRQRILYLCISCVCFMYHTLVSVRAKSSATAKEDYGIKSTLLFLKLLQFQLAHVRVYKTRIRAHCVKCVNSLLFARLPPYEIFFDQRNKLWQHTRRIVFEFLILRHHPSAAIARTDQNVDAAKRSELVVRWRPQCDTLSTPMSRRKGLVVWRGGVDVVVATAAQQQQHRHRHRHTANTTVTAHIRVGLGGVDGSAAPEGDVRRRACGRCAPRPRIHIGNTGEQPVTFVDESAATVTTRLSDDKRVRTQRRARRARGTGV